jgi:hypothetical protein
MPIKQNNSRGGASEKSPKPAVTASAGGSADRTIAADKSSKKSNKPKSIQNKKQNPAGSNTKNSKNKQADGKSSDAQKQSSGKTPGEQFRSRQKQE